MKLEYKENCAWFRGDIPCKPHKEHNVHCDDCQYYDERNENILIIKLGAIGDVIRTSPLIQKLKEEKPKARIWWLTYFPDVVPNLVDKILPFTLESIVTLEAVDFDLMYNLDKDLQACALAKKINAKEKIGFTLKNGKPAPINELAQQKFNTGLFDDVSKANKKSYLEEIFEICGWKFEGQEYIMDCDESIVWDYKEGDKPVIGLNTGCGVRWTSRLWKEDNWVALIKDLQAAGYMPLLLGGKQEDEVNTRLAQKTGAKYLGYFSLKEFISLVNSCDVIVSAVTMGMHIAMAMQKQLVLMNNIFNPHEFELYGRGEIIQPRKECTCYFTPKCKNPDYFCMDHLEVEDIFNGVKRSVEKISK